METNKIIASTVWDQVWAMEPGVLKQAIANINVGNNASQNQTDKQTYSVSNSTAIIPIVGTISKYPSILDALFGGVSTLVIQQQIQQAISDNSVDSIVLYIDSPGGTVAGTSDLADFINGAKQVKPIIAFVSDHCFSAAYWLASNCTSIIANEAAFIGSIGVYSVINDSSEAAKMQGIAVNLISAGEYKGLAEPGLEVEDKYIEELQRQVDSCYELFCDSIARGRNLTGKVVKELADGRSHIAADALAMKLIDGIGSLDTALNLNNKDNSNMSNKDIVKNTVEHKASDEAPTDDSSAWKQVLTLLQSISDKLDQLTSSDDEDEPSDEGNPDDADGDSSDDADAKVSKALSNDRARLKAIHEACVGRADFAIKQFSEGKTAVEAKAALSDILLAENTQLNTQLKKQACSEGVEPLALGNGSGTNQNTEDPEVIWAMNIGDVKKMYSDRKDYFLAALKHNKNKGNK